MILIALIALGERNEVKGVDVKLPFEVNLGGVL